VNTFAEQLAAFAEKAKTRADEIVGRVVASIAAELDQRSPVGDASYWKHKPPPGYVGGRFRGNWQLGVDVVPSGETGRIDPGGAETLSVIIGAVPPQAAGHIYYLFNGVPYAQALEDGHSRQAPNGMVGLTVLGFNRAVEEAAAQARGGA